MYCEKVFIAQLMQACIKAPKLSDFIRSTDNHVIC